MKSIFKHFIKLMLLVLLVIGTTACGDHYIVTITIFTDGSCEKIVEWSSDTEKMEIDEQIFPIHIDQSWTINKKKTKTKNTMTGAKKETWTFQARKKFATIEELNQEYENQEKIRLTPRATFAKQFKGIFTSFTYKETYPILYFFKKIPASNYFTPEEVTLIYAMLKDEEEVEKNIPEELENEMEKKIEIWLNQCLFEEFFPLILHEVKKMNDSQLTGNMILEQRKQLLSHFYKLQKDEVFELNVKEYLLQYGAETSNPAFERLWQQGQQAFTAFENDIKAIDQALLDEYTNKIVMPGIITATNAPTVTGNTVTWEFPLMSLIFKDFDIWVESRQVNWWFVTLGGVVLVLIIIGLISTLRLKKITGK